MPAAVNAPQRLCPCLPTAYGYPDACSLVRAYARGDADPVSVTSRCLEAAADHPEVFIRYTQDRALDEAALARARYRANRPVSALDGVPMAWKDLFDLAGTVTTAGAALNNNKPAANEDAPLPNLAARAGLVCLGKLNTTEFAYSSIGTNPHFGNPVNPHSEPEAPRIPGGSSSGSAVAVAAGVLPLAVGTDTGGSIRIPAAFNGICGFKPTVGHYDRGGMTFLAPSFDTPGTYARSMRDLLLFDRVLRGLPGVSGPVPPHPPGRFTYLIETSMLEDALIASSVKHMLLAVGRRLEEAGACVGMRPVPVFREAMELVAGGWISGAESFALLEDVLDDPPRAALMDQRIRKRLEMARNLSSGVVARSNMARTTLAARMREEIGDAVLVVPTVGHGAPLMRDVVDNEEEFFKYIRLNVRLTMPGNLLNMPGVSLPSGLDEAGMPIGVTLYGHAGEDEKILQAAYAAERAIVFAGG